MGETAWTLHGPTNLEMSEAGKSEQSTAAGGIHV